MFWCVLLLFFDVEPYRAVSSRFETAFPRGSLSAAQNQCIMSCPSTMSGLSVLFVSLCLFIRTAQAIPALQQFNLSKHESFSHFSTLTVTVPILSSHGPSLVDYLCLEGGINHTMSTEIVQCKAMLSQSVRNAKILTISNLIKDYYSEVNNHGELFALTYAYEFKEMSVDQPESDALFDISKNFKGNKTVCFFGVPEYSTLVLILTSPAVEKVFLFTTSPEHLTKYIPTEHAYSLAREYNVSLHFLFSVDLTSNIELLKSMKAHCDIIHVVGNTIDDVHRIVAALVDQNPDKTQNNTDEIRVIWSHGMNTQDNSTYNSDHHASLQSHNSANSLTATIDSTDIDGSPNVAYNNRAQPLTIDWQLHSVWNTFNSIIPIQDINGYTSRGYQSSAGTNHFQTEVNIGVVATTLPRVVVETHSTEQSSHETVATNHAASCHTEQHSISDSKVILLITYTIRVFAENAFGLQTALRSVGYENTFIVPDPTIAAIDHMRTTFIAECEHPHTTINNRQSSKHCQPLIIQILLGAHDLSVLLPHYIAFNMEQFWSPITFGPGSFFDQR